MHHMIPAFEFRRRARMAMKPVMSILLLVALIATLPTLINDTVTLIADANPNKLLTEYSDRLMQVMEKHGLTQTVVVGERVIDEAQIAADLITSLEEYQQSVTTFVQEKGLLIALLTLMILVFSPVLTMGMINALLHALRKQPFTPIIALSRMKYILKALGLVLLFALRVLLWMLPGIALMIGGLYLPAATSGLAMFAGLIASMVMGVIVSYRYAMVTFIMADNPSVRLRDCFRRSDEVMQRRKLELFSLELSFIGWSLLLSLVQTMLMAFGAVIGLTLGMFASLFLTVYTNCAQAAFYQEYAIGPVEVPEEEAPEADELS